MTDVIRRGHEIADVLSRTAVQEAFGEIEADIIDRWRSGATVEDRETAFAELRGLEALFNKMQSYVDQGNEAIAAEVRDTKRKSEI